MYGYLILAVVFAVAVAGAGVKGYSLGEDHVRAEVAIATEAARADAEAKRAALELSARKAAATLQAALGKQRTLNRDLGDSLAKHIAAMPKPAAGCPEPRLTDELCDDINRASHAAARPAIGGLPSPPGAAGGPTGAVPSGPGAPVR